MSTTPTMAGGREFLVGRPLALDPRALTRLCALHDTAAPNVRAALGSFDDTSGRARRAVSGIAVIPVRGMITLRNSWWGTTCEEIQRRAAEYAADPAVEAIVLDVDSPGGMVDGMPETHEALMAIRRTKPLFAVSNTLCASGALWLASAANRLYATESSELGSIGVYMLHIDERGMLEALGIGVEVIRAGARKVEANPWEELSATARAELHASVEHYRQLFVRDVARGRGRKPALVGGPTWGAGITLRAPDAVKVGMADGMASWSQVLIQVAATSGRRAAGLAPARLALERELAIAELE